MAKTELMTLPVEIRSLIWELALRPDPGVYHFDPDYFVPLENTEAFADESWNVPKRKFPTAMHLCQESRDFSQYLMAQDLKNEQKGTSPCYYLGCSARPFDPRIDTFWFSQESHLRHPYVLNIGSVIGSRIHTIQYLALSSQCIVDNPPGPHMVSSWNAFRWRRLGRFVALRRIDIILGVTWNDNGTSSDLDKIEELLLEKWHPTTDNTSRDVQAKISNIQTSIVEVFQQMYDRMQEDEDEEPPLPAGASSWQNGSRITFHASSIKKIRRPTVG